MNPEQLTQLAIQILDDNKAIDIKAIDVSHLTDVTNNIVICTATSNRHAKTLADKLLEAAREHDTKPCGVEGEEQGQWILIDFYQIVAHIMLAEPREYYSLEKLWSFTKASREHAN